MAEKLAYVGRIIEISPIEKADRLEQAIVVCGQGGKWAGVIQRGSQQVGDLVRVFLQDALLPKADEFSFMERYKYRIRIQRLRGALSECLIMPLDYDAQVGEDISQREGVAKYEKPVPSTVSGDIKAAFPGWIPKTDEPNFQSVPHLVDALRGQDWVATMKIDGSSATIWWDGELHCASRNWELKETQSNAIWQLARRYNLESLMPAIHDRWAIQLEVAGPGIQKNPLALKQIEGFLFDAWMDREYVNREQLSDIAMNKLGMAVAPIVAEGSSFNLTDDEMRACASREYDNGSPCEGIVIRSNVPMRVMGERLSFKVINLEYAR